MNISDAFPSNYLKAADLQGRNVTVTIAGATIEEIGQGQKKDRKLVLSFFGKEKALVCNKTNASTIEKLYGSDTDAWIGQPIILCAREVEFQGEMVMAIRVSLQRPNPPAAPARVAPQPVTPAPAAHRGQPHAEQQAANLTGADEDVPF